MKLHITELEKSVYSVRDLESNLVLILNRFLPLIHQVKFDVHVETSRHKSVVNGEDTVKVTGRDVKDYSCFRGRMPRDPALQYIEIGPGLGGFIPYILSLQENSKTPCPKPIAIDPVDYTLVNEILNYAQKIDDLPESMKDHIELLKRRASIISNPDLVRLYKAEFGESFLINNPDLEKCADVIVDNVALAYYTPFDRHKRLFSLYKRLLKDNGRIFSSDLAT